MFGASIFVLTWLLQPIVDTSTTGITLGEGADAVYDTVFYFGEGVLVGLLSVFATVFALTRITPLREWLDSTKADWVIPAVRAFAVLGGGVVAGLIEPGGVSGAVGGLLGAVTPAMFFINRAIQQAND